MKNTLRKAGVSVPSGRRFVVPNDSELGFMRGTMQSSQHMIPIAVRIRKMTTPEIMGLNQTSVIRERQRLENICRSYMPYKFVPYFQFKQGYKFTPQKMSYFEQIQQTQETDFMTFYETDTTQPLSSFITELSAFGGRNPQKIVIPVLDPTEKNIALLTLKAQHIVSEEYKICGIMGRNYNARGWNKIMPILKAGGVSVFVFGIYPRMTRRGSADEYSTLPAYIGLGADFVSHGLSWSGGKSTYRLLQRDWIYRKSGSLASRQQYEFSRADAVIKSNDFCVNDLKNIDPAILAQSIQGFRYFKNSGVF